MLWQWLIVFYDSMSVTIAGHLELAQRHLLLHAFSLTIKGQAVYSGFIAGSICFYCPLSNHVIFMHVKYYGHILMAIVVTWCVFPCCPWIIEFLMREVTMICQSCLFIPRSMLFDGIPLAYVVWTREWRKQGWYLEGEHSWLLKCTFLE